MSTKFTDITVSDYTNNSIVVQGETKKYKEDLKKLGGKYNSNLKNGPGWIFPKTSEKELSSFINGGKRLVSKEEEEKANELSKQKSKEWNEKRALSSKSGDKTVDQGSDDVLTQLKNIMAEMALIKKSLNMILTDDQKKRLNKEEKKIDKPILENSDSDEEECGIVNRKRLLR
jgi:hypothetical protein